MFGNPWHWLRDMPHVTVRWVDLPRGILGLADFKTDTIFLAKGMTQAERRSVCWHEALHLLRGKVPAHLSAREEKAIDAQAARDLIPLAALIDAMAWSNDESEIAAELTVSVDLVRSRLRGLDGDETVVLSKSLGGN